MAYANWPRSYGRNETTGYVLMGRRPPLPSPPPRLRAAAESGEKKRSRTCGHLKVAVLPGKRCGASSAGGDLKSGSHG